MIVQLWKMYYFTDVKANAWITVDGYVLYHMHVMWLSCDSLGHQGNQFYSIPTSLPGTPNHGTFNQAALLGHPGPHGLGMAATAPQGNVVYVPLPYGQHFLPTGPSESLLLYFLILMFLHYSLSLSLSLFLFLSLSLSLSLSLFLPPSLPPSSLSCW